MPRPEQIKQRIAEALGAKPEEVEEPTQEGFGDFAYPCFNRAKAERKSPSKIAEDLSNAVKMEGIRHVRAIGPYVNFYIDWAKAGNELLKKIDGNYGKARANKTAVVDLSSPNPAHPFHMGTTRSTLLGEALCRILESQGWDVKRFCYINDLGKQAATLLVGYRTLADGKLPEGKPDVWLGKLYFEITRKAGAEPDFEQNILETINKLENRDEATVKLGKKVFGWCVDGFKQNWKLLGIKFDDVKWESDFIESSRKVVDEAQNLLFESEGAKILDLEKFGLPNTVFVRKGGSGLYLTRDIACTEWKFKKYRPDLNVWVVAEDQSNHFRQQKKALELLGHPEMDKNSVHLAYGMVLLEGKKMSARKGWFVLWDEMLLEGKEKALAEIKKRWPELMEEEAEKRAETIALGAIIYFINKYAPEKTVNFIWDQALSFEGDTGPYLQYTHARAGSILDKAKAGKVGKFDAADLADDREIAVLKLLAKYPNVLQKSAADLRPHYLADYLHSLADAFNNFYQNVPVLKAETEGQRNARLKLVESVKTVLKSGLYLLGMEAPEKM
ncbi:MAG: arginine--tRNA ligase [Candidatus Aenigmatarchaeota archaeon]